MTSTLKNYFFYAGTLICQVALHLFLSQHIILDTDKSTMCFKT